MDRVMDPKLENQLKIIENQTNECLTQELPKTVKMVTYCIKEKLKEEREYSSTQNLICVRGIRHIGKTTALKQLAQYYHRKGFKVAYIDGSEVRDSYSSILHNLAKNKYNYVFIDEACKIIDRANFYSAVRSYLLNLKIIITGSSLIHMVDMKGSIGRGTSFLMTEQTYYEERMFKKYPVMSLDENPYKIYTTPSEIEDSTIVSDDSGDNFTTYDTFICTLLNPYKRDEFAEEARNQVSDIIKDTLESNYSRYVNQCRINLDEAMLIFKLSSIYLSYVFNSMDRSNFKEVCPFIEEVLQYIGDSDNGVPKGTSNEMVNCINNLLTSGERAILKDIPKLQFLSTCKFLQDSNLLFFYPANDIDKVEEELNRAYVANEKPKKVKTHKLRTLVPKTLALTNYLYYNLLCTELGIDYTNVPAILMGKQSSSFRGCFTEMIIANALTNIYRNNRVDGYREEVERIDSDTGKLKKDIEEIDFVVWGESYSFGIDAKNQPCSNISRDKVKRYLNIKSALRLDFIFVTSTDCTGMIHTDIGSVPVVRIDTLLVFLESLQQNPISSYWTDAAIKRFVNSIENNPLPTADNNSDVIVDENNNTGSTIDSSTVITDNSNSDNSNVSSDGNIQPF